MILEEEIELSRSEQNYLKVIYTQIQEGRPVSTLGLAEAMQVKPASVTNMLQKLDEFRPRLVEYHKRRGVSLTAQGEKAALKIIRRHRLLEQFLYQVLGYSWDRVHAEAEELEHVISPYFEDRLAVLLGEPEFDPHGDPIPNRDLELAEGEVLTPLSNLLPGRTGIVRQVNSRQPQLLAYLDEIDMHPGTVVQVIQRNPLDGTLEISIGQAQYFFGPAISDAIYVHTT
jgi:DtxR family transcriptional regulator, Mn-dependent transcriptional regulator